MHFEFLIEDQSGKKFLETFLPQLIKDEHTFKVISYKGCGNIPQGLKSKTDPQKRILLDRLPKLLKGYGKTYQNYDGLLIIVLDLDTRDKDFFQSELNAILNKCEPRPNTNFTLAIEEMEAWLLGDYEALITAYPKINKSVLAKYKQDSICGTWELLADAIHPGGSRELKPKGFSVIGQMKSEWAENIAPHMTSSRNKSKSFNDFVRIILDNISSKHSS